MLLEFLTKVALAGHQSPGYVFKTQLLKITLAIAVESVKKSSNATVAQVCSCFNLNRDAWYKYYRRFHKKQFQSSQVVEMVQKRRKELPREGVRKLHHVLADDFHAAQLKIGRDLLFDILRQHNMLVYRKRSFTKTTNSYHHFHTYNNLIKELQITRPNQVWVSDITYIRTVKGFCYLALITDLYSRKIVGYDVSDSLELAGCLRALRIAQRQARQATALIHHSDRGAQYCSHPYVKALKRCKIQISMTALYVNCILNYLT